MHGTYCGPLQQLQGETALLLDVPGSPDDIKAQFDNFELRDQNGKDLAYGWHIFRRRHFLIDPPIDHDPEDAVREKMDHDMYKALKVGKR